ncbi:DoxX family protein, partial [Streptomyces sp. NPDC004779]
PPSGLDQAREEPGRGTALATPAAGAAAAGAMAGAVSVHAPAGFFAQAGGYEYPAFLGFTAAALGVTGAGRYSLDHATGHVLDRPWVVATAFIGSALAAAAVVGKRAQARAEKAAATEADLANGSDGDQADGTETTDEPASG